MFLGIVGKMSANNGETQKNRHKERHDMLDRISFTFLYTKR